MHISYWHYARESEFSGQNLEMGSSDLFLNYCAQLPLLGWGAMGGGAKISRFYYTGEALSSQPQLP